MVQPTRTPPTVPLGLALAAALCLVALVLAVGVNPLSNNDIWMHITTGRLILERHAVHTVDEYSFTRTGAPYVAHEWLAQVAFAILYALGGVGALIALKPIALAAAAGLVALTARELGAGPVAAFWGSVLAIVSMTSHLYTRPHLFTFVGLAASGWLLARRRRGDRRAVWALAGLEMIWVNLHGGFALGIVLAAAMGAFIVAGAMALAAMINPRGPGLFSSIIFIIGSSEPGHRHLIQEWFSPFEEPFVGSFHFWIYVVVLALSLAGAGWSLIGRPKAERSPAVAVTLLLFAGLSVTSKRHASLLGIVAAPWLALWGSGLAASFRREGAARASRGLAASSAAAIALASAAWSFGVPHESGAWRKPGGGVGPNVPVAAMDAALSYGLKGNCFASFAFAGYVVHRAWPGTRVFIDSRTEVYGGPFLKQYTDAVGDPDRMASLLRAWPMDYAILSYKLEQVEAPVMALRADPRWALIYFDDLAMIFAKRDSAAAGAAGVYELADPYLFLSGRARMSDDPALAVRETRRALEAAPASRVALLMHGTALQADGRDREAVVALEQVAAAFPRGDPARPIVLGLLGTSYAALGERAKAEEALEEMLAILPDSRFARQELDKLRAPPGR